MCKLVGFRRTFPFSVDFWRASAGCLKTLFQSASIVPHSAPPIFANNPMGKLQSLNCEFIKQQVLWCGTVPFAAPFPFPNPTILPSNRQMRNLPAYAQRHPSPTPLQITKLITKETAAINPQRFILSRRCRDTACLRNAKDLATKGRGVRRREKPL